MDFIVSNAWIKGWPDYNTVSTAFQFATRWSGGCLRDYSSGVGGFCVFEDNDTPYWDCGDIDSTYAAPAMGSGSEIILCGLKGGVTTPTGNAACGLLDNTAGKAWIIEQDRGGPINIYWDRQVSNTGTISAAKNVKSVYKQTSGRKFMFLRLAATDFDLKLKVAWDNAALQCDKGEVSGMSINKQDGRAYFLSVRDKKVDMTSISKVKFFDYPECTLSTNDWNCQIYLPQRSKQTDGYPRFDTPGVVQGYYFAAYIPGIKELGMSTATQVFAGATQIATYATAVIAAVASLAF